MARDSLTAGGIGEGSHWLMANQAGWNTGQTSYIHGSRSVWSHMPHAGQHRHKKRDSKDAWRHFLKYTEDDACVCIFKCI